MAIVEVRRWDDTSAPVLDGLDGSLITLLDAVLVDGYGSQSALGWTKEYSGTDLAAYRINTTDGTGFYIRVDDSGGSYAWIRGYESMTGISTGTNLFPSGAVNLIIVKSYETNSTERPWIIYGDNIGFYFLNYFTWTPASISTNSYCACYFIGDFITYVTDDVWNCAVCAGVRTSDYPYFIYQEYNTNSRNYVSRNYDGTGADGYNRVYFIRGPGADTSAVGSSGILAPTWNSRVLYAPFGGLGESSTLLREYRGAFPGVYQSMHRQSDMDNDTLYSPAFRYHHVYCGSSGSNGGGFFMNLDTDFRKYPR